MQLNLNITPWYLLLALISSPSIFAAEPVQTASATQTLIKGFAKYQANRVESLALDTAIYDIAENKFVKKLFPSTVDTINGYEDISGQRLLPLLSVFFENDLKNIKELVNCIDPNSANGDYANYINKLYTLLEIKDIPDSKGNEVTIVSLIKDLGCKGSPENDNGEQNEKGKVETTREENRVKIKSVLSSKIVNEQSNKDSGAEKPGSTASSSKGGPKGLSVALTDEQLNELVSLILTTKELIDKGDSNENIPSVVYVHQIIKILDVLLNNQEHTSFRKLKNYGLFLASLHDTSKTGNSDEVANIIDQFIDEGKVYKDKMDSTGFVAWKKNRGLFTCRFCENMLFISSYYGFTGGFGRDSEVNENYVRAFGPVGIELKLASYYGRPLALNLAPIDIGGYITNELTEEEYDASVEDIESPSIFLSYTLKTKPISFLIGKQFDVKFTDETESDMGFIGVAFDLPLMTLY